MSTMMAMRGGPAARPADEVAEVDVVLATQAEAYGCPHCGFRSSRGWLRGGGVAWRTCAGEECGKAFAIVDDRTPIDAINARLVSPKLRIIGHPRTGTPSHGIGDACPVGGGEFFRSRGLGKDRVPCCVFCGVRPGVDELRPSEDATAVLLDNIAAFVRCRESGERIVKNLFRGYACLDYREYEPDRVQVKIGACRACLPGLHEIDRLAGSGRLSPRDVVEAFGKVGVAYPPPDRLRAWRSGECYAEVVRGPLGRWYGTMFAPKAPYVGTSYDFPDEVRARAWLVEWGSTRGWTVSEGLNEAATHR